MSCLRRQVSTAFIPFVFFVINAPKSVKFVQSVVRFPSPHQHHLLSIALTVCGKVQEIHSSGISFSIPSKLMMTSAEVLLTKRSARYEQIDSA